MAEPTTGMRGTKFSVGTEGSVVRDVADRINLLQPDAAPLIMYTRSVKKTKIAKAAKYEWFEDALSPNTVVDTGGAGTGTTINVATGTGVRVRVNDILVAPNGESILVTSISTDALTVVRSMGAVAAYSLVANDELVILGTAMLEGSNTPTFRHTAKAAKNNFIQIFKDLVLLTEVQSVVDSYGGNDRAYQRMKVAIEHKRSIEHAFLFGDAFEDTSGAQARRGTGGLINSITTNVTDFGGVITEAEFETFLRTCFRYHPSISIGFKSLFACPYLVSAINFWAKQALVIDSNETTYGLHVAKYRSAHGDLQIIRHWLLQDFAEFQKYGIIIEPTNVSYRFLPGLDTKLHIDTQNKSDSTAQDEYRSYVGAQTEQEQTHGIAKGITGFAA